MNDKMSTEEFAAQYMYKLLDFHIPNQTAPIQYLTWGNLTKCPALLMDSRLDGLDWDTIPGLFNHLDAVKATLIDLEIVTGQWVQESFDIFNPDRDVSHNLALVLFLTPNHQSHVKSSNEVLGDYVFSAVVMYKPMAQHTCPLRNAVNDLCECARDKKPSLAFVSLSEVASYFPYPEEADHVDYAIVPVDNVMTQVVGPTSDYIVGWLLRMIEGDVMNVVLPPTFGIYAKARSFDWVPHPVRGGMWSNYQLVDLGNSDENFTHMVPVAPLDLFRADLGDQVRRSALGFLVEPLPMLTYTTDLTRCGYEVASQFASALQQGKSHHSSGCRSDGHNESHQYRVYRAGLGSRGQTDGCF